MKKNSKSNWNIRKNSERQEQNANYSSWTLFRALELMISAKSPMGSLVANNQDLIFTTPHETKAKKQKQTNKKKNSEIKMHECFNCVFLSLKCF